LATPARTSKRSSTTRGRTAEDAVADYLQDKGWEVLGRNQRTPVGEIDLVCRQGPVVVMVEVKARSSNRYGEALEAVGPRKERRLRAAAAWWMIEHGRPPRGLRFDVIAVELELDGTPRSLNHLRDVFAVGH
jgi:putative endonuclease